MIKNMEEALGPSWWRLLKDIFEQPYMGSLGRRLAKVDQLRPALNQVFDAFRLCQPEDVKVIIIGQDPYPHKHANGLAFSTTEPDLPLTLRIVFNSLAKQGFGTRRNGDLTDWAQQGVFLLNTVLTCTEGVSLAHRNWGWEKFVGQVLYRFSAKYTQPYVVLVWGRHASDMVKGNLFWTAKNVEIYETIHPVAESYSKGELKFIPHFKQTNEWLVKQGQRPIIWNPLKTSDDGDILRRDAAGTGQSIS